MKMPLISLLTVLSARFLRRAIGCFLLTWAAFATHAADSFPTNDFELVNGSAAGVRYLYDKSLAPVSSDLQRAIERFASAAKRRAEEVAQLKAKAGEVISEVDRALGVRTNLISVEEQHSVLTNILTFDVTRFILPKTIYILTFQNTKARLRKGVRIPYFAYDSRADQAAFTMQFGGTTTPGGLPVMSVTPGASSYGDLPFLVFPVPEGAGASAALSQYLENFLVDMRGAAVHEVVELSIVRQLRLGDPFFRWFSDGFANAVSEQVLQRVAGADAARLFAEVFDPGKCSLAPNTINLRWWMPANRLIEPPIELEAELQKARYAYATALARKIIQAGGINSVRAVLEELSWKTHVFSTDIEKAIQSAAKVDVKALLDEQQPFSSVPDGILYYSNRIDQLVRQEPVRSVQEVRLKNPADANQLLFNLFRLVELQVAAKREFRPAFYVQAAQFIHQFGFARPAVDLFRTQIKTAEVDGRPGDQSVLEQEFIKFAWQTDQLPLVYLLADDLLKTNPTNAGALSVEMFKRAKDGREFRAKEVARTILENALADPFFRERAQAVLAK